MVALCRLAPPRPERGLTAITGPRRSFRHARFLILIVSSSPMAQGSLDARPAAPGFTNPRGETAITMGLTKRLCQTLIQEF